MNGVSIIYNAVLAGDIEAILFVLFMLVVMGWVVAVLLRIPAYFDEQEEKAKDEFIKTLINPYNSGEKNK